MIKVARAGVIIGEYPPSDIPALVRAKVILPTDDYWTAGMAGWGKVDALISKREDANVGIATIESKDAKDAQGGTGEVKNPKKSPSLLREIGIVVGVVLVGILLVFSLSSGIDPKAKEAFLAHKKKAEAGDIVSQIALAMCYQGGAGTGIDWGEAESWLLRAAQKGNAEALFELAEFYGMDAPPSRQDKVKAYAYATLAYDVKDNLTVNADGLQVRGASRNLVEFLQAWTSPSERGLALQLAEGIREGIKARSGTEFRMKGVPASASASLFSNSSGTSFVIIGGSQEMRGEPPYRYYRITGEVKNVGRTPDIPQIEMKLRNSSGRVIKSANTLPSDTPVKLQPGETCGLDQRIYSDDPNCTLEVRFIEMAPRPR